MEEWSRDISAEIDQRATRDELHSVDAKVELAATLEEQDAVASARYRCLVCGGVEPKFSRLKDINIDALEAMSSDRSSGVQSRQSTPRIGTPRNSSGIAYSGNSRSSSVPVSPPPMRPNTADGTTSRRRSMSIRGVDGNVYRADNQTVDFRLAPQGQSLPLDSSHGSSIIHQSQQAAAKFATDNKHTSDVPQPPSRTITTASRMRSFFNYNNGPLGHISSQSERPPITQDKSKSLTDFLDSMRAPKHMMSTIDSGMKS